jgi:glycosyltransferase involved in cell wall biosynthesis
MQNYPRISVVTVCYQAADTIEKTILSVVHQNYQNMEYIVIDGGSKDGTVDIITKYRDRIAYFVSERDKGIYDAMNKAIQVATSEWINFMNAGDLFATDHTINNIFGQDADYASQDVIYGDTLYKYIGSPITYKAKPLSTLDYRMAFCHQSSFVRTDLMKAKGFDLRYRYVADYAFFYHLYKTGHSFHYLPMVLTIYSLEGGFSNSNILKVMREEHLISQKRDLKWFGHLVYTYQSFLLHRFLTPGVLNRLRKFFSFR